MLALTFVVSLVTTLVVYIISFPIGVYSAVRQYSLGDYALTFIGFLGLATPNFLLALVLLYLANVWFGKGVPVVEYKPADLFDKIRTGDTVEVNGETGEIVLR